jgi:predicted amidohydrolase YtcJ
LQDAKIPFSSHHDAPVANPDMMRVLSATVNRTTRSGQVLGPDQRVEPVVGLKSISLWPAMQYGEGKFKGSIEVGKLADFVVLSDNPTTMDRLKISDVKVLKTIKEGKTIYELKPTTQSNQQSSCMASVKCQEMISQLGPQAGFAQLLPHNHNH